jgi:hypothetical protein
MASLGSESRSRRAGAKPEPPDLRCRIALRLPEAAATLGCSESTLRRMFRSIVIGRFGDRERSGATPVSLWL